MFDVPHKIDLQKKYTAEREDQNTNQRRRKKKRAGIINVPRNDDYITQKVS